MSKKKETDPNVQLLEDDGHSLNGSRHPLALNQNLNLKAATKRKYEKLSLLS